MTSTNASSTIVLIGHSGVGKSALGPYLAEALGYGFFDVDQEIADLPVVKSYNADLRRAVITRFLSVQNVVIAAGCEDFCDEIMTADMKGQVFSVWLDANSEGRPARTVIVYTQFYKQSRSEQDKIFSAANLSVSLDDLKIPEAAELLISRVKTALALGSR